MSAVLAKVKEEKQISLESSAILSSMFSTIISPALEILDNGKVIKLESQESKRHFYRVKDPPNKSRAGCTAGSASADVETYHDVKGEFCFCYFYARECLRESGSALFCKHVLAAKLAEALELTTLKVVEDRDFAPLYLSSRSHLTKYDDKRSNY